MGVRVATYAKYELSGLVLLSTGTESQNSFAVRSWPEYLIGSIDLRGLCCRFLIFTYWPLTLGQLCSLLQVQHRNVEVLCWVQSLCRSTPGSSCQPRELTWHCHYFLREALQLAHYLGYYDMGMPNRSVLDRRYVFNKCSSFVDDDTNWQAWLSPNLCSDGSSLAAHLHRLKGF